jgi:hypothetical protein
VSFFILRGRREGPEKNKKKHPRLQPCHHLFLAPQPPALILPPSPPPQKNNSKQIDELGDNPSDAEIKAALAKAPIPSDDCCYSVRPFIDAGCPCDEGVVSLAGRANIKASTLRTLSRAVPVSSCNNAQYGSPVSDHCSASAFAQITARIAEEAAEDAAEAQAFAEEAKAVAEAEKAVADAAEAEPKAEEAQTTSEPEAEASTEEAKTEEKQE